jgi:hypothetical protein
MANAAGPSWLTVHELAEALFDHVLRGRPERADRADQLRVGRNDAHRPRIAGLHRAQADDSRVDRRDVAGDDRLRRRDDVAGDEHRIDGRMRMRAVPAASVDRDLDAVRGRHRGPRCNADLADRQRRPVVQREHLLGRKALEQPVGDHRLRTCVPFLAGLEN